MFQSNYISNILFATTLVNLIVSIISWRRRHTKGGGYFAWGLSLATLWTLASALDYAAISIDLKVFFAKIEVFAYVIALTMFMLFVLSFASKDTWLINKLFLGIIITLPTAIILLAWTNQYHHWIWSGFTPVPGKNHLYIFEHGPAFNIIVYYAYFNILVIVSNLWQTTLIGSDISKRQARLLLTAILALVFFNLLYLFDALNTPGVDWSSITFSITGLLFLIALYGPQLLNIVPVARHTLIEWMSDIILVIDKDNRLIDFNLAAKANFNLNKNDLGAPIESVLSSWPFAIALSDPDPSTPTETFFNNQFFDLRITPLADNQGYDYGKMIALRNITARRNAQHALIRQTEDLLVTVEQLDAEIKARSEVELELRKYSRAIEQMASSVVITDLEAKIEYVNPAFLELTGYTPEEIIGQNPNILQSGHTPSGTYEDMWLAISTGQEWRGEFVNKKKNGELYWESSIISPVRNATGQIAHYVAVKDDISERKRLEGELEKFATTDTLTKVLNRRKLSAVMRQEVERAYATADSLSLLMLDIDRFKTINDNYGHLVGDAVIQTVAQILTENTRSTDYLGRFGGDEFIILLTNTTLSQAKNIAEKLCDMISAYDFSYADQSIHITISVGVASTEILPSTESNQPPNIDDLLSIADRALYQAKEMGRNQVYIATS